MNEVLLDRLVNPRTGNRLSLRDGRLMDAATEEEFQVQRGIPVMVRDEDVTGQNEKYQGMYNRLSHFYDAMVLVYAKVFRGAYEVGDALAADLSPGADDEVLEVSVGTGNQIQNLVGHGYQARFTGLDLSMGMLGKCQAKMKKLSVEVDLVQGNAEQLPFRQELFDVVFHFGGINFFNDREQAIREMIRVAKPGARIFIGDESAGFIRSQPSWLNRLMGLPDPAKEAEVYQAPVDLVPKEMEDLTCRKLWNGRLYWLSFRKPQAATKSAPDTAVAPS